MRWLYALLVICLSVPSAIGRAQTISPKAVPTKIQLNGLDAAEAATLISKLEAAQGRLKAGKFQSFDLLAGSTASSEMSKVSPYDAFLAVPFKKVWDIKRVPTDNRLWQPYRLSYVPVVIDHLQWDIEVVLGVEGDIERVTMLYTSMPFQ